MVGALDMLNITLHSGCRQFDQRIVLFCVPRWLQQVFMCLQVAKGTLVQYHYQDHKCWSSLPDGLKTMIALPHHLAVTPCEGQTRVIKSGGHRNLRGLSLALQISGHSWPLLYPDYEISWIGQPDKEKVDTILWALKVCGPTFCRPVPLWGVECCTECCVLGTSGFWQKAHVHLGPYLQNRRR